MPREIPQTVRDNYYTPRRGESFYAIRVRLPLKLGETEDDRITLYYSQAKNTVLDLDGDGLVETAFLPYLKTVPSLRFSDGNTPDGGECVIHDFDQTITRTLAQLDRVFDNAAITFFKVWRIFGACIHDELAHGFVKVPSAEGNLVKFTCISDMSRKSQVVGGKPVAQRCTLTFKDGIFCTYAGVETFCSHVLDDEVEGCKKYGHEYEFDGVPTLNPDAATVGLGTTDPPAGGNGNGWDGGGFPNPASPRFDPDYHPQTPSMRLSTRPRTLPL